MFLHSCNGLKQPQEDMDSLKMQKKKKKKPGKITFYTYMYPEHVVFLVFITPKIVSEDQATIFRLYSAFTHPLSQR